MARTVQFEKTRFFAFNLIPPISEEEIKKIIERDNSILYSFVLIFGAMLGYLLLLTVQLLVTEPQIAARTDEIIEINERIATNNAIIIKNGELIIKGNQLLQPLLAKDIKLEEVIDIADQTAQGADILSYSLENSDEGVVVISARVESKAQLLKLFKDAHFSSQIKDPTLRSLTFGSDVHFQLAFSIVNF